MQVTREQIQALKVGDLVRTTFDRDGFTGKVREGAVWSNWRRVVSIHAQKDDVKGKAFVCFYLDWGNGLTVSDSAKEGEEHVEVRHA